MTENKSSRVLKGFCIFIFVMFLIVGISHSFMNVKYENLRDSSLEVMEEYSHCLESHVLLLTELRDKGEISLDFVLNDEEYNKNWNAWRGEQYD
jgi:hypothetical protein